VISDIDKERAEVVASHARSEGYSAVSHLADVASWVQAGALISRCIDEFGKIDGLVNNAGISQHTSAVDLSEDEIRKVVETNLLGTTFCGVHALQAMSHQGHGTIINVSSGAQAGWRKTSVYSATKAGIMALTYSWAMELADTSIRVNAVVPSANTPMLNDFLESADPEQRAEVLARRPAPDPALVAPLVTFLLSDDAAFVRGHLIRLDRGELSLMNKPTASSGGVRRDEWTHSKLRDAMLILVAGAPANVDSAH
jgi:NAD(P)-dependent dehydrogenase (short-subunit alcohol dehydrogenase family)